MVLTVSPFVDGQLNGRCEALGVKVVILVCGSVFLSTQECCLWPLSGFCKLFSNTLEARSGFPLTCHPQHAAVYLNNRKVQRVPRQKETLGSYTLATGIGQLRPLWWGKSLCLWKGQTAGWDSAGFGTVRMLLKEIAFCHAEGIMCFQSPDLTCSQRFPSCKGKQCFSS